MSFAALLTVCLIIYNGVPVTGQQQCAKKFMELDLIKYRAEQTANGLNAYLDDEIRLLTEYQFNCSSTDITSVILGIDVRLPTGSRTLFPSIQLYRLGAGNVQIGQTNYTLIDERVIYYSTSNVSTSGVYEYPLDPPITANSIDLLAVYQPNEDDSIVRVFYVNESDFVSYDEFTFIDDQMVLVYPVTDGNCVNSSNSIAESTVRQNALKVHSSVNIFRRQYIYPEMKFSCNGTITKWIYGGTEGSGRSLPELQIWRQVDTNNYMKVGFSLADVSTPIDTNVYEFVPQSPLVFQEGDIFGVYIPRSDGRVLILKEQRQSGPINLRVDGLVNDTLSTIAAALATEANDFPLVTAEISVITPLPTNVFTTICGSINDEQLTLLINNKSSFIMSSSTFKFTEMAPDRQPTMSITVTGLVTIPVVSCNDSTYVLVTFSVVLVILIVGVVILAVVSCLCLMIYKKKQLPLQEGLIANDILAQDNLSFIPGGSQWINLEDNPSYSNAPDLDVDGIYMYIDINTSYNTVHHANSIEEDDYI